MNDNDLTSHMIKCGQILTHKTGKKRSQEKILEIVFQYEYISQKELQDILQIEAGSLSEILSKLERREFIEKKKDENDKRKLIILLTQKGKDKIVNRRTDDQDMFDMLTLEEQDQLNDMLIRILSTWKERREKYSKK